jgi:FkbM family methyltransferase
LLSYLKYALPPLATTLPIVGGPFRGGSFRGAPRASIRKVIGAYEHELNPWLRAHLSRADALFDVGANDGYFTFGCAAVFSRLGKSAPIIAWEPEPGYARGLNEHKLALGGKGSNIEIVQKFVGEYASQTTDRLADVPPFDEKGAMRTLVKIDVEGAELDVCRGAGDWLHPRNFFLVEVHAESLIKPLTDLFATHGVRTGIVDQKAHWLLGRESRAVDNRWMVSID